MLVAWRVLVVQVQVQVQVQVLVAVRRVQVVPLGRSRLADLDSFELVRAAPFVDVLEVGGCSGWISAGVFIVPAAGVERVTRAATTDCRRDDARVRAPG